MYLIITFVNGDRNGRDPLLRSIPQTVHRGYKEQNDDWDGYYPWWLSLLLGLQLE